MLMTVNEYASFIGKSIPLVYKRIRLNQVKINRKFGRILIDVPNREIEKQIKES